jgi:predicted transcriptional regulator
MVALTLRLDDKIALRLKLEALAQGRPQSEIIREAIAEYLATHEDPLESLESQLR